MVVEGATIEGGHAHGPTLHHGGETDICEGDQGTDIHTEGPELLLQKGGGGIDLWLPKEDCGSGKSPHHGLAAVLNNNVILWRFILFL